MKKQTITGFAFVLAAGAMLSSCDLLKDLQYEVQPKTLEMHGDSVRVKVDVQFPEKGLNKKASVEITPLLGTTALKTITIQGEKATGNGSVVLYKEGGKISFSDVVAYKPEMEDTDLKINGTVSKGGQVKAAVPETSIAKGTIITPLLVNKDFKVVFEKDNFNRVTEKGFAVEINFDKGKSNVKSSELKDADIKDLAVWLDSSKNNPKIDLKAITLTGFASPEGENISNDSLSNDRAKAAQKVLLKLAKKAENEKAQSEIYNLLAKGEDYDGFKKQLEKSDMDSDEKQLIIRVLEMHKDDATRETEMRNMGKTFSYLDENIFPKLRRTEINVTYDKTGYSDEELKALSVSNPDTLTVEELLFAATLVEDLDTKLNIYLAAEKNFNDDHRAFINAGNIYYMQNKLDEAKSHYENANKIKETSIGNNNLGAIEGMNGNREAAKNLLMSSKDAGSEVSYNLGILNIMDGKYNEAVANFGSFDTFNKALAQVLSATGGGVEFTTLDASEDKDSGQGYYLRAISNARQGNVDATVDNLKKAFDKDVSFKEKAMKDKEFLKFAEVSAFTSVVK
ncbi:MAG: tetratricopeptide repeat protein [Crocinitomicaceae bacterium]